MLNIFITGTNRGLGFEFVKQYLKRGEKVFAACRNPGKANKLNKLKIINPSKLEVIKLDVRQEKQRQNVYSFIKNKGIRLDIIINNAGISGDIKSSDILGSFIEDESKNVFWTNTISPLMIVQTFIPVLKENNNSRIINITSWLGSISNKNWAFRYSYCASKTALNMFTKMLSIELKQKGITVVALSPGHVKTDLGGYDAPLKPEDSIAGMIKVIDSLTIKDTGRYINWQGEEIEW